jgi:ankyrin repeat protein
VPAAWVHGEHDGQTALHFACAAGQLAVAEFLILNGELPSVWCRVVWIVRRGTSLVSLRDTTGAPILGTDDRGKSCVDVADAAGQAEISLWLSKRLKDGCS